MKEKPNLLLIAVDTLRADHLGCYGYRHDTSPHIDALASEGVLAEQLFCPAIPTHPSFTTLYTGQHPITHNIVAHGGSTQLARETPVLPEIMLKEGYTTCAFDNLARVRPWFSRGYEFYIDPSVRRGLLLGVTCEEINSRAIPWLRTHADEPFFMFLHYWDPHYPLVPPDRYRGMFYEGDPFDPNNSSLEKWWDHPLGAVARDTWLRNSKGPVTDADYVTALYDQEIRYLDDSVSNLLEALDGAGLSERTLVVFLADHGTSLTEHDIFFEHHGLYDSTIHVPLVLRWPGRLPTGERRSQVLDMSDVAPTLLEGLGLEIPEEMEGRSFWEPLAGEAQAVGRSEVVSLECTWQAHWSLRTSSHKFILARDPGRRRGQPRELYDLRSDPGETRNLVEDEPDTAAQMEARLEEWIAERLRLLGRSDDPLREQGISLKHLVAS